MEICHKVLQLGCKIYKVDCDGSWQGVWTAGWQAAEGFVDIAERVWASEAQRAVGAGGCGFKAKVCPDIYLEGQQASQLVHLVQSAHCLPTVTSEGK